MQIKNAETYFVRSALWINKKNIKHNIKVKKNIMQIKKKQPRHISLGLHFGLTKRHKTHNIKAKIQ